MKKDQILARMRENKGFITAEEVVAMHISRKTLIEMASEGMIKRIKPGLYALNDVVSDPFYNVIFKNPQAIFSHYTALYLQGYIKEISNIYDEISKNYTYTEKLVESSISKNEYEFEGKLSNIYNLINNNNNQITNIYDEL